MILVGVRKQVEKGFFRMTFFYIISVQIRTRTFIFLRHAMKFSWMKKNFLKLCSLKFFINDIFKKDKITFLNFAFSIVSVFLHSLLNKYFSAIIDYFLIKSYSEVTEMKIIFPKMTVFVNLIFSRNTQTYKSSHSSPSPLELWKPALTLTLW